MDSQDMARVAQSQVTVSDKIRALARAGVSRADIARHLGKRYQHVRNVLEADQVRAAPPPTGFAEQASPPWVAPPPDPLERDVRIFRLVVDNDGRVTLPPQVLSGWGLTPGSVLAGRFEGEELTVMTQDTSMRRAQELVRTFIPAGISLSEELIADRRREAKRERRK